MYLVQNIIKDTKEINQAIYASSVKLEKILDSLGTIMVRTQQRNKQSKSINETALKEVTKGYKKTLSKSYSFGLMDVEEDIHPNFYFRAMNE